MNVILVYVQITRQTKKNGACKFMDKSGNNHTLALMCLLRLFQLHYTKRFLKSAKTWLSCFDACFSLKVRVEEGVVKFLL